MSEPRSRTFRTPPARYLLAAIAVVIVAIGPLYLGGTWMRLGAIVATTAIGAIGLTILTGLTGQLSLAHAFFVGVGAFTYSWLASPNNLLPGGWNEGWPPLAAAVSAVITAGIAGLLFSPIAARLRGIYLGVASFSLVFIGQDVMTTATPLTGGYNGRSVPDFSLFGLRIADTKPSLSLFGVAIGASERLWYLSFAVLAMALVVASNLVRSRVGRAFIAIRDSEASAAAMGISVQRHKALSFTISSMFAGLAGVLYALYIGNISADSFGFNVSIQYLVAVIIGGLGSLSGATAGALFVASLPILLQNYAGSIPFISEPGGSGLSATDASQYIYGAAILVAVLKAPRGLAGLWDRRPRLRTGIPPSTSSPAPAAAPPSAPSTAPATNRSVRSTL